MKLLKLDVPIKHYVIERMVLATRLSATVNASSL